MDNYPTNDKDNYPIEFQTQFCEPNGMDRDAFRLKMIDAQDALKMNTRELSRKSGVSYDTLAKLRQGRSKSTSAENARAIAIALGFSVDALTNEATPDLTITDVPLIGPVSAGPILNSAEYSQIQSETLIRSVDLPPGRWIAFRVDGDSMDRISPPDSIIFVDTSDHLLIENACYIVADGEGGATYKRFRSNPTRFEPVSGSPAHETIFPDNSPTIIGRVRRTVLEM